MQCPPVANQVVFSRCACNFDWLFSGKKSIAGIKRASQAEIIDGRACCETPSCKNPQMYANSSSCAMSDPFQEGQDVRGQSGSPETTPTETSKRARVLAGLCCFSLILLNSRNFTNHL